MTAARHLKSIFSKKNLRSIFVQNIGKSAAKGIDRIHPDVFGKTLPKELQFICHKVHNNLYKFTSYKEKLISKGANGYPRVLSIPTVRDRLVLRGLCDLLTEVFPDSVPKIPQVKLEALQVALGLPQYQEFIKIDLRSFYPSIPHDRLIKTLKKKIRKPAILDLIVAAIKNPTVPESRGSKGAVKCEVGVPQGLSISNLLAEIYLKTFDDQMKAYPGIWYQRYVDDILILCPAGTSATIGNMTCEALKKQGLNPHGLNDEGSKSKTGSLKDDLEFLGYHIANRQLSIRKPSIQKYESGLAEIFTAYRHKLRKATTPHEKDRAVRICEWRLNLRLTGCIFRSQRLGWVFYFSQITDTSRLRAVDNTVSKMLQRFQLDGKVKQKRVLRTYYECKRKDKSEHHYIPNFDEMSVSHKRDLLILFTGDAKKVASLSDKKIHDLFEYRISAAVRELEKDLVPAS